MSEPCHQYWLYPPGLKHMGLDEASLLTFSRPFVEGMSDSLRARALGDDPSQWEWGNSSNREPLDIVLLVFARSPELLEEKGLTLEGMCRGGGVKALRILETTEWSGREHFGFRDGLSQPMILGIGGKEEKEEKEKTKKRNKRKKRSLDEARRNRARLS
jgi:hypothetical protein